MKIKQHVFSVLIILLVSIGIASAENTEKDTPPAKKHRDYVIGCGDVLEISVWKDEELTRIVSVLPDGQITFPLVGHIMAKGKTIDQIRREISLELALYMPQPEVNISVRQPNSMTVFVIGKVNRPGSFQLSEDYNVLQVLSMAGGLTPYAKKNKIKIFRKVKGKTYVVPFRYGDVSKGKHLDMNISLRRGDVVVVP